MDNETSIEKFADLMQTAMEDPLIKNRIIEVLQLSSFERRTILNNWLEQLQRRNASESLLSALSCLFDDKIAEAVLVLINDHKI
jgi:hypothetical protein